MVLRSGKLFYFGSLPGLSESLHSAGKGCPNEFNLADHVMFVLQTESGDALDKIEASMKGDQTMAEEPSMPNDKSAMTLKMDGAHAGFCTQLYALSKREAQNVWRDKAGLIASVMVPLILNVFFACIFFQVGDNTRSGWSAGSHFGGMTQAGLSKNQRKTHGHDHVCRVHAMPPFNGQNMGVCRYAMLSPTFSDTGGHWWNVWCSSAPVVEVPLGSWHFFARICHPDLWGCAILHRQIHGGTLAAGRFCFLIRNMETRMEPVEAIDSITLDSWIHFVSGEPLIRFLHVTTDVSQKVASRGIATDIFECCNYLGCRLLPDGLAGQLHYVPGRISQIDRNDRLRRKYFSETKPSFSISM